MGGRRLPFCSVNDKQARLSGTTLNPIWQTLLVGRRDSRDTLACMSITFADGFFQQAPSPSSRRRGLLPSGFES